MLIINILRSGVVIHFDLLKQIVDKLITDRVFIGYYLNTVDHGVANKVFIDRLMSAFHADPKNSDFSRALMRNSGNPTIQEYLEKILESNNQTEKEVLFNYRVVLPVAPIVKTELFKKAVSTFVNESEVTAVPTQYTCAFFSDDENKGTAQQAIEAICAINKPELQRQYAEHIHSRVSWRDNAELRTLSNYLKKNLPAIDCTWLDEYITEREGKAIVSASTMETIELIRKFRGLRFLYAPKTKTLLIVKKHKVHHFAEPYCINELLGTAEIDLVHFSEFVRLVIGFINQGKILFQSVHDFELYYTFSDLIEWETHRILCDRYALLDYFFDFIGFSVENMRKYSRIFIDTMGPYTLGMYDMSKKASILEHIITSDLSPVEKVDVLAWLDIGRKYRKDMYNIANDAIAELQSKGESMPYSLHFLIQNI